MGGPMTMKTVGESWESARPRERGLTEGFETLADAELVSVLLGTGEKGRPVAQVAMDLLEQAGGVAGLALLGPHALAELRGVGVAKAARVAAALELGKRALLASVDGTRLVLSSSAEVARWARVRLASLDHEQIWALSLDGR